jgi:methylenetetrahydrofolate reductase (NADPH)
MVAAVVAAEQVRLLQANGVDEFHFYTLNRADLAYSIAHILGVRPTPPVRIPAVGTAAAG